MNYTMDGKKLWQQQEHLNKRWEAFAPPHHACGAPYHF